MQTTIDEQQMKSLMKAAFVEVLEERRDLLRGLMEEALEDIALAHAIEEGLAEGAASGPVSHEDVFAILRGEA